ARGDQRGAAPLGAFTRRRGATAEVASSPWTGLPVRATGDPRAAVWFPGSTDLGPTGGDRDAGRADPDPGVFQLWTGLLAQPSIRRAPLRGRPLGADRRKQFLRVGRRHRGGSVRGALRCRAGHRGRRLDRSTGDVVGSSDRQRQQALVRSATDLIGASLCKVTTTCCSYAPATRRAAFWPKRRFTTLAAIAFMATAPEASPKASSTPKHWTCSRPWIYPLTGCAARAGPSSRHRRLR